MNRRKAKLINEEFNLNTGAESCNGIYNGYMTAVVINKKNYSVTIAGKPFAETSGDMGIGELQAELLSKGIADKCFYERNAFRIITKDDSMESLAKAIKSVTEFYRINGFIPCCCSCSAATSAVEFYEINGKRDFICGKCFDRIVNDIKLKKVFIGNDKSCFFTGFFGALSGAFLGIFVWALLSGVGFNSIIPSILMTVFICCGYKILGGCIDKKGIITCCVMFPVFHVIGQYFGLAHWIYVAYKGSLPISYLDAFASVIGIVISTTETFADFVRELITSVIFDLIILIAVLRRLYYLNKRGIIFKRI